ncbi:MULTISPECIES: hypothetical protein [Comamonas]|uniref:hypothetical protein n=1 Tax=Comamonas TaxID=283 RepID=UPI0001DA66FD|nr:MULTISPECIES: hypothetical protein [Comamonas]EFI60936.1 hypothetical protein CTS44_14713 [Comamonas thiooxydans]TFF58430.1 hypothetical protein EIC84_17120 [Comamonas sp. A23]
MFGFSPRSGQRKDPTWTQAPSSRGHGHVEPVWRDGGSAASYEPTQQQAAAPRKSSSAKLWASAVLAVVGLLAVAFLFLSMVDVVEEQVARNQPQSTPGVPGVTLIPTPAGR